MNLLTKNLTKDCGVHVFLNLSRGNMFPLPLLLLLLLPPLLLRLPLLLLLPLLL